MNNGQETSNASLAVLIDADNANPSIVGGLFSEIAKLGVASVKRIYGNWTSNQLASWKDTLLEHSIQPVQQFSYTVGKNATDSAMIIDAMDLLYTGHFAGFCLVSSDSDFTRLASRLRESGKAVYGFGERKTPRAFVAACDRFIYTEVFVKKEEDPEQAVRKRLTAKELRGDTGLVNLIRNAIDTSYESEETEWAELGPVGNYIRKAKNDFDPRFYGYSKLVDLISAIGLFDVERRNNRVYIRNRRKRSA